MDADKNYKLIFLPYFLFFKSDSEDLFEKPLKATKKCMRNHFNYIGNYFRPLPPEKTGVLQNKFY